MYGLQGIFNNGVMGMMAFSEATGTLSDNIANLKTIGYKRVQTDFATVLGSQRMRGVATASGPTLTPFGNTAGVQTSTRQFVGVQGPLSITGRNTDLAINGGGLFTFASGTVTGGTLTPDQFLYSRAGDLQVSIPSVTTGTTVSSGTDAFLTNRNGQYLMGVAVPLGTAPNAVAVPTSVDQLVPIQVSNLASFPGQATTAASISAVIPAPSTAVGASATTTPLNVTATDDLTLLGTPPVTATDTFDIEVNGSTYSITIPANATLTDIQTAINAAIPPEDGTAVISGTATNATLTIVSPFDIEITDTLGASAQTLFGLAGPSATIDATEFEQAGMPINYIDVNGDPQSLTLLFTNPMTIAGVSTTWQLYIADANGEPSGTAAQITFDSLGRTNFTLNITHSDTSVPPVTSTFALDMSDVAMLGQSTVQIDYTHDGIESGAFEGFSIQSDGTVVGNYAGGASQVLYRLPVAAFINPDVLEAVNGTMFLESTGSGVPELRFPGDEFSELNIGALEESNVDLADNLASMIVTQRAYSSAATVVRTADEMSTVVRDLLR